MEKSIAATADCDQSTKNLMNLVKKGRNLKSVYFKFTKASSIFIVN